MGTFECYKGRSILITPAATLHRTSKNAFTIQRDKLQPSLRLLRAVAGQE